MTREEAKEEYLTLSPSERLNVIDDIYDDLESRTCDNCKFHQNYNEESSGNIDSTNDKYCNMIGINTPSYFGCNRFEGLTDD